MTTDPVDPTAAERAALRAELATRPVPSLRPPTLVSPQPLRPVPGGLLAKLEIRRRAGFDPRGADHPRRERAQRTVYLPLVLSVVLAVIAVVGFATSHTLLGVVAALITAGDLLLAGAVWRWVQADPLRITSAEGHLLDQAGLWESRLGWTDALNRGPERALLTVAMQQVADIATDPAWCSGYLDGHRLAFDLAAELDGIDAAVHQVAVARAGGGAGPDVDRAFDSALDRVLALRRYQAGLSTLTAHIAAADLQAHAAPAIGELRGSVDQSQFAVDGIGRLTAELAVITSSVDSTAEQLRRDNPR